MVKYALGILILLLVGCSPPVEEQMGLGQQRKTWNGGRTDLTVDGDLTVNREINGGRLAQIDSIAAEVLHLQGLANTFSQPGTIWNTTAGARANDIASTGGGTAIVFVSVGPSNTLQKSADGKTFNNVATNPFIGTDTIMGASYGNGVWMVCGYTVASAAKLATSTDGTNFSAIASPITGQLICVRYGNGVFMLIGLTGGNIQSAVSSDGGTTWSAVTTITASGILAANILAVSGATWALAVNAATFHAWTSTNNGTSWTDQGALAAATTLGCAIGIKSILLIGGGTGAATGKIWRSSDGGITWSAAIDTGQTGASTIGLASSGTILAAFSSNNGNPSYSNDTGQTWAAAPAPYTGTTYSNFGSSFGAGLFTTVDKWSSFLFYGKSYLYVPKITGFGTPTSVNFFWQRKPGSNMLTVMGFFVSGVPTAVTAQIGFPVGLLSDSGLIATIFVCGIGGRNAVQVILTCLITPSVGYITIGASSPVATTTIVAQQGATLALNGDQLSFYFEVPIAGWN